MSITIVNEFAVDCSPKSTTVYVAHWGVVFATVDMTGTAINDSKSVSTGSNQLTATGEVDGPTRSASMSISAEAQNVAVAEGSHNTIEFLIGSTAGTVTAQTLTLVNQCSFPVTFVLAPSDGSGQVFTVGPKTSRPVDLSRQYEAWAEGKAEGSWVEDAPSYTTDKVSFYSTNTTLTLETESESGSGKFRIVT